MVPDRRWRELKIRAKGTSQEIGAALLERPVRSPAGVGLVD